jgi:hypothetical protein
MLRSLAIGGLKQGAERADVQPMRGQVQVVLAQRDAAVRAVGDPLGFASLARHGFTRSHGIRVSFAISSLSFASAIAGLICSRSRRMTRAASFCWQLWQMILLLCHFRTNRFVHVWHVAFSMMGLLTSALPS